MFGRVGQDNRRMANRFLPVAESSDDRRAYNRLPIERDVRYKVLDGKKRVKQAGSGKTINMSSAGVLFTTESTLEEGKLVELAVSWPALLNDALPLKLVADGRLVRIEEKRAVIAIEKYEFKIRGDSGL
jgi:PilZ domain-containing protein